jgi:hypothetical protein
VGRGRVQVAYRVENTGNVVLSAAQKVSVSGALGTSNAASLDDLVQILPGDDVVVTTVVDGVRPTIRAAATVDLEPYAGTADAKESFAPVSASTPVWAVPWALLGLLTALAVAAMYAIRRRRPVADGPRDTSDDVEEVPVP